jgi:hypothetical protein
MKNLVWAAAALLLGCGGSSYEYAATAPRGDSSEGGYGDVASTGGYAPPAEPAEESVSRMEVMADASGGGADFDSWDGEDDVAAGPATVQPQYAQNQPPPQQPTQGGPTQTQPRPQQGQATDAVDLSQPLLIYTATLHLGVYQVEATQETVIGIINEVNGFLSQRTDNTIVVRVPAAQFQSVLDRIEDAGDVLHRQVEALDVGEEYRDLAIRIRNSEAMRDRLEQLLRQASNVEEALAVERELQRITESIEQMKGRLRWLSDRIAFSTITIHFQPRATETLSTDPFRLPFQWLDTLGLSNLLSL